MPTTIIELPRSIEVKEIKIDEKAGTITIEHRFLPGQSVVGVATLSCKGAGGMESRAVLSLSANSGLYRAHNVGNSTRTVKFDLPPEEFKRLKEEKEAKAANAAAANEAAPKSFRRNPA